MGLGIFDVGHRSKPEVLVNEPLYHWIPLGKGNVHLDSALAVTQVVGFLLGLAVDVGEKGRQVVVGHVLEGELPKLLVLVGVVFGVVAGVLVAATVAQPYIEALVG